MTRRSSPLARLGKAVAVIALLAFTLFPIYFMLTTAFSRNRNAVVSIEL